MNVLFEIIKIIPLSFFHNNISLFLDKTRIYYCKTLTLNSIVEKEMNGETETAALPLCSWASHSVLDSVLSAVK